MGSLSLDGWGGFMWERSHCFQTHGYSVVHIRRPHFVPVDH